MHPYGMCGDDFYVNLNLNTEMELDQSRESTLHYFEQLRKKYPLMRNFYCRDKGEHVLEEDKGRGQYRWATVEAKRICSGVVNPDSVESAMEKHRFVLELTPFALSISQIDCESLNLMYGFDFSYSGNHNQLIAEALGVCPGFESLLELGGVPLAYEPSIQIAIDEDCRLQCRVSVESRTSAYQVRTGEFPEDQLSVYVTARRFGSLDPSESFAHVLQTLSGVCEDVIEQHVLPNILLPLQQTISAR
ncbi:MAG: hypothetical protein AAGA95_19570 [Pseudomonadota bacterium]